MKSILDKKLLPRT